MLKSKKERLANQGKQFPSQLFLVIVFLAFTFLFWFTRLWHFEKLMTFYSDQELFMREVWEMVDQRQLRLIGPMVITKMTEGRGFFIGPVFYYLLAILSIIASWNVILITKVLISVWWLAALGTAIWLGKKFSWFSGLAVYGIFAVYPLSVDFSRLIWNPSFLPLISLFFFIFWVKFYREEKVRHWFLMGLFFGLGLSFHYSAFLWLVLLLLLWLVKIWQRRSHSWFFGWLIFGAGTVCGNLPMVIFELKHNFYNLRTILIFFQERLFRGEGDISLGGYYLFSLLPLIFLLIAYFFRLLEKKIGVVRSSILLMILITFLIFKIDWQREWGIGMPEGWNIGKQQKVAVQVCQEAKKDNLDGQFEIAATMGGDTPAHDLRWWLFRNGCRPLGVADYPLAQALYLVAPDNRPSGSETVWEVYSIKPFTATVMADLGNDIKLYRLVRRPEN